MLFAAMRTGPSNEMRLALRVVSIQSPAETTSLKASRGARRNIRRDAVSIEKIGRRTEYHAAWRKTSGDEIGVERSADRDRHVDPLAEKVDLAIAEHDFQGRPAAWVAADIVRIEDGNLAEHWDVLQDEATKAQSLGGLPMFGQPIPRN
jgi:hypothetical protein